MTSASALVLTALIAWTLLLLMEPLRAHLLVSGPVAANAFAPDNPGLSPFMQRLARAHANCPGRLLVFGVLVVVALLTDKGGLTDPLPLWLRADWRSR